ncbi:MAG: glycosyl transferase family 2, partial [Armatimonadetes bacterium]|nr:glycosyl transferase family 2 [Armatimonadota bacterium]
IRGRIAAGAPVKLIVEPGANRSRGRNRAIEETRAEIIAVTDVGARPREDWFERIIAPLEADPTADVVAGYYEAEARTAWEAAVAGATVPRAEEVRQESFLPSARSVAFRRTAWERAGRYPEQYWHNEDTPFGLALRAVGARFVFEPRAVVLWRPQSTPWGLFRQFYRYAVGDAEARIWYRHYAKAYLVVGAAAGLTAAAKWWPLAGWLVAGLAVVYWARHAARAFRRTTSPGAALLAPLANAVVDLAHVAGYTRGLLTKKD